MKNMKSQCIAGEMAHGSSWNFAARWIAVAKEVTLSFYVIYFVLLTLLQFNFYSCSKCTFYIFHVFQIKQFLKLELNNIINVLSRVNSFVRICIIAPRWLAQEKIRRTPLIGRVCSLRLQKSVSSRQSGCQPVLQTMTMSRGCPATEDATLCLLAFRLMLRQLRRCPPLAAGWFVWSL